jgi:tagatose 1,6-diphosphate aldolase
MKIQDIDYLNSAEMTDGELQLTLIEKVMTSKPDSEVPVYKFQMINTDSRQEMGEINLRAGFTENIEQYRGNIGFTVHEPYRGQHFAGRSCLLLRLFLNFLGLKVVWLTCNTDNIASKKTLEQIESTFVGTTEIGEHSPYVEFYPPKARIKLRYKWDLNSCGTTGNC